MNWADGLKRAFLAGSAVFVSAFAGDKPATSRRLLAFEPLEPRLPLSAAGLVEVGTQPQGGLSGKIVYVHGGHGYTADNLGSGAWSFQRPNLLGMIEDLGNVDQMTYLADYLWRAGATVVPLRPVGHQPNEVIVDNINATFVGAWSNSTSPIYFGNVGDVPYRYASTSATETAYARYQPNIPQAGHYPVYAWTRSGSDRASDQLYRVHHSGGITEVTVNHRRVGNGLIYLGTYYFEAGTGGHVDISNRSSEAGRVVIADMIRFGNGMGDIDRGGGISGRPREDEAGLYWVMWHVDRSQGIPSSVYRATTNDRDATVSLSPRYAAYMNREQDGSLSDRVFVSFHSNAGSGTSRGVLGLYNGNNDPNTATPNQFLLAHTLALEIQNDMLAQAGAFEHNWHNRGSNITLDRSDIEFGEINNLRINGEFDATIMETGYHDNTQDAQMLRDPKVRDALARATYQGVVNYFRAVDGNTTPVTKAPDVPTHFRAESLASGSVTVSWQPPAATSHGGDAPTGFRIYVSVNGYGFDGGTFVAGGATNTATLSGYDPNIPYYFKVVAVNTGGESPGSEVMTALPSGGGKQVLIVNGFDRMDRQSTPKDSFPGGPVDRVRPLKVNSRDYVYQVHAAIHAARPGVQVASTSNEAVINGAVNLSDYHTVIWILGEESTRDRTFDNTEQALVEQFIAAGGNLFLSGAEIGWDLDQQNNGRSFYRNTLKGTYAADDSNTYTVGPTGGGIFAGLPNFSFDNGTLYYDVDWPDVINPQPGAVTALNYIGGIGGGAAIQAQGTGGRGSVVMFGFPFETITNADRRRDVIDRVFDFFSVSAMVPDNADFNNDGAVNSADYVIWRRYNGTNVPQGTQGDANHDAQVNSADYDIWKAQFGTSPGSGAAGPSEATEHAPAAAEEQLDGQAAAHDVAIGHFAVTQSSRTGNKPSFASLQSRAAVLGAAWDWSAMLSYLTEQSAMRRASSLPSVSEETPQSHESESTTELSLNVSLMDAELGL